jgi:hypothetical protein
MSGAFNGEIDLSGKNLAVRVSSSPGKKFKNSTNPSILLPKGVSLAGKPFTRRPVAIPLI